MIPYMIIQNNTWEGRAPLESLYYQQKAERGIPDWMPAKIDLYNLSGTQEPNISEPGIHKAK